MNIRIFTLLLSAVSLPLLAAVPLRWTVETSKANPMIFDEFAGATYEFEAAMTTYSRPLEIDGEPHLYWQTNGMGSTFWVAPATAVSNRLSATWIPAYDVGAKSYNCFIGVTGSVYNAAFTLRLRHSPGAAPNTLPLPVPTIDCSSVEFLNAAEAPWILMPDPSVTTGYMLAKSTNGVEWVEPGISTNVVNDIIREAVETNWLYTVERSKEKIDMPIDAQVAPGLVLAKATNGVEWVVGGGGGSLGVIAYITDISNKHYRVIAQKNPMGQIVAAVEQAESTPTMKTVEAEEARAYAAEYGINLRLTNEVARSILADEDLNEKISSISALGRFISTWNCVSGRPGTEPKTATLDYKGGDYYLVTSVSTNHTVNYIPSGTVYTNGTASTAIAPDEVHFNDIYRFSDDGQWIHQSMEGIQTTFEQIAGYPTNNVRLAQALQEARMPAPVVTNIASGVVTNLVNDGYLATQSVTNGLRRILDMNAYHEEPGTFAKTNTDATVTVSGIEVPAYTSLSWSAVDGKWTCYDSINASTVDMTGDITNPDALLLGFPNGELTERANVTTVYSRLATTNDLSLAVNDLDARIISETNRAQTAEAAIADDLASETNRAQVAEADLDARIIAETNRAQTVEAAIADDLTAETNRAQVAEADLDARIIAETNRAQTAEAAISVSVVAETNRAQAEESALDAKIIAETNRAQVAEAEMDTRITSETNRAQTAEAAISVSIVTETNRAQVAEASIRTDLASEVTRATNAESDLGDRIDDEDARAQSAEAALDAKIITETNRAQIAEAALGTRITSETTRATSAEATLDSAISAERNRAQGIESQIRIDLTNETTRATGAESALDVRIVAETNRAQQADITLSGQIVGEISRAQSEESLIRGELLTEKLRAQTAEGAVENLVVAESNRASTAELALSGSITAETVRATGAESSLQTLITIVNNQLTNRIAKSESALIAETNRSIQADAALDLRIDGKQDALPAFVEGRYLHVTNGLLEWASVEAGGLTNVSWGMITGTLSNQADLNTALTNLNAKKQDQLPTPITDYYLHANEFTGELEWKGMSGGDISNYNHLVNRPIIEGNIVTGGINLAAADLNLMTNLKYTAAENGKVLGVKDANLAWVDGGGAGGDYRTKLDMTYYIEELFDISAIKAFVGDNDIAMWLTDEDINEHGDPNDQWIYTIQKKDGSIIGFSDTEYNGKATALAQTSVTMIIYPGSHSFTVTRKSPSPAATGHKLLTDNYFTYVIPTNRTDSHKVDMIFVPDEVQNIQTVQSRSDIPSWDDTTNRIYVVNDDNSIWRRDGSGTWKKIGSSMNTNAVQYIIDQNVATNNIVGFDMFEEQVEYLEGEISRLGREKRGIYDLNVAAHFLPQYSTVKLGSQVIPSKDITIQKETYGYHVYAYTGTFIGTNICYVDDNGVLTSIGASITLGGMSPTVGTKVIVPAEEIAVVSKTQTNLVYSAAENGKVLGVKDAGLTWVDAGGGSTVYINGSSTPSASANVWTPTNGGTNEMVLTSSGLYGTPKWAMKGEMKYIREPANYDELFTAAGLLRDGIDWTGDILGLTLSTNSYPVESGYFKLYNQGASFRKMILQSNTMRGMWQNTKSYGTWLGWERIDERVVDNLTSTASDMSLSARQGKILSEGKQNKVSAMGGTARPVYVASSGIFSACGGFVGDVDTPVYMSDGTITKCSKTVGSANKPAWVNAGKLTACSNYGGGTQVTLNNTSKAASTASFYAPTSGGTEGQVLISNGDSAPTWQNSGMSVIEIFSGSIAPEKTGTLSVSYNNFKFLVVGWKNPTGHMVFTPVISPGSYTTTSSDIQVSTDTAYCIFYFPSTTSIKFKSGTSSSSIAKVYGIN